MLEVHPHARKHGLSDEDIRASYASGFDGATPQDTEPTRWLMLGFDTAGRLIELVVVELVGGHHLAIHAMPARKSTIRLIREARQTP